MKTIIFTDTNKIFGLFARVVKKEPINNSILKQLSEKDIVRFVVSSFVLEELLRIAQRKGLLCQESDIDLFCREMNFFVHLSQPLHHSFSDFVSDIDDAQIIQDALESGSQYILTDNIKDFKTHEILKKFGIVIVSDIFDVEV